MEPLKMYINGEWVKSENKQEIPVRNPATGKEITSIPRGAEKDVDLAVRAAKKAFESGKWSSVKPHERGYILHQVAEKIRQNKDELARLESLDVGKPISQAYADVEAAARYFEFYAGAADKVMGKTIPIEEGILDFTVREPIGITAHIIPWNYPIQILSRSTAAAIATGNTVVVKSAEDTPLTAVKIAEFFDQTDLPNGVFNHVTGYGHEAGAALSRHSDIDHITFTGSVQTGITVMKAAAENVVPVTLELGGKSPNIVFSDCDMEQAADGIMRSIIQNAGQTCSAGSRLIVEKNIKDKLLSILVERLEQASLGQGTDDPDIGPILNENQFNRVMNFIDEARNEGTIITGGEPVQVEGCEGGYFIKPTIVDEVSHSSHIAQQEVFGPVLTVFSFQTVEQAIQIANDTEYGLVTGIWTSNINKAHTVANSVQSGQVFINNYGAGGGIQMPFGGYKKSGFGREKGLIALQNYTQIKNVAIKWN